MEFVIKKLIYSIVIVSIFISFGYGQIPVVELNEADLSKRTSSINSLSSSVEPQTDMRPALNDPKVLHKYQEVKQNKRVVNNLYDILEFKNYRAALFEYNESAKELFYQKKIDYLLNEVQKDKYGFDVFASAFVRTGSYLSAQQTNVPALQAGIFKESSTGVALHANKLLYDGQYTLINKSYDILNKRLAEIKSINAKEKLLLFGVNIYSNLFVSQEKLKLFQRIYDQQKRLQERIKKSYDLGAASTLNYIDAQNDLLNIQKAVISLEYTHLHNEYILRHSIQSQSNKKYTLVAEKINFIFESLLDLQKEAIQNSSDIALESNKLKINKTDFFAQKRRYYPSVNFNSYLGYGTSSNSLFFKNLNNTTPSSSWELSLRVTVPLYNRGDIILNKEKELHSILLQKNILSQKTRSVLIEVERSYHTIKMIQQQKELLTQQVNLSEQKMRIAKKLYLAGAAQYRDYSDAMKSYLQYKSEVIDINEQYTKEMFLLAVLIGKRDLYGEN